MTRWEMGFVSPLARYTGKDLYKFRARGYFKYNVYIFSMLMKNGRADPS